MIGFGDEINVSIHIMSKMSKNEQKWAKTSKNEQHEQNKMIWIDICAYGGCPHHTACSVGIFSYHYVHVLE